MQRKRPSDNNTSNPVQDKQSTRLAWITSILSLTVYFLFAVAAVLLVMRYVDTNDANSDFESIASLVTGLLILRSLANTLVSGLQCVVLDFLRTIVNIETTRLNNRVMEHYFQEHSSMQLPELSTFIQQGQQLDEFQNNRFNANRDSLIVKENNLWNLIMNKLISRRTP